MNWESMLMPVIAVVLAAIGGIGGYFTLRAGANENTRRIDVLEGRATRAEADLAAHKDFASNNYVRTGAIDRLEQSLTRLLTAMFEPVAQRLSGVEHQVRGMDTKLDQRINQVLQKRRGEE